MVRSRIGLSAEPSLHNRCLGSKERVTPNDAAIANPQYDVAKPEVAPLSTPRVTVVTFEVAHTQRVPAWTHCGRWTLVCNRIVCPTGDCSFGAPCSRSGGLWMFGAKVLRRLRTRLVPADEHHVDATDAGLGLGHVSADVQGCAAGSAPALGFRVAGGHGSTVRQVWRGSQDESGPAGCGPVG